MNRHLALLVLAQGLLLTNNICFIGINGLVGLALAPRPWMAMFSARSAYSRLRSV